MLIISGLSWTLSGFSTSPGSKLPPGSHDPGSGSEIKEADPLSCDSPAQVTETDQFMFLCVCFFFSWSL